MAVGDATAADVPTKYDVVINGKGYVLLDSLEESIPFRTHRAVYGQTQPFVERQNVSNTYGDNAQDFFQQIRQRDWSLGEQQKFFRAGQDGRYWMGSNVDVSVPGQVRLSPAVTSLTFAAAVRAGARENGFQNILVASSTNLYKVNSQTFAITDLGAHGLGVAPGRWGVVTDGNSNYLSATAAGTVGIRKWNGSAFSTFSSAAFDALAFVNNTLYGIGSSVLGQIDTAGAFTSIFQWRASDGSAAGSQQPTIHAYGGKLLILFPYAQEAAELWIYDGSGTSRLAVLPENFIAAEMEVLYGVAYISGSFMKTAGSTTDYLKPAVLFFDGSQLGKLWQANDYNTVAISNTNQIVGPHPALGVSDGRLIFTDETTGNLMAYNPAVGGVSSVGTFTANTGDSTRIISTGLIQVLTRNQTGGYVFPATTYPSTGYVISSLIDFDSSLTKVFRGVTVEFAAASDGNGGTIDVSYQINGLDGSWTSLATGVSSGVETVFPAAISGHSIAVKLTINKGTSTAGPAVKSMTVRGAPVMPIYARGEYILDCTATEEYPRELRDGSFHPLTGYGMVQNLVTAKNSSIPITITDKVNGTYTGFVDVNDAQGFDVYEIHPSEDNPDKPGSFVVRLTTRGV